MAWWCLAALGWASTLMSAETPETRLSVEVAVPEAVRNLAQDARLVVVVSDSAAREPRLRIGDLGAEAPTLLGVDVAKGSRDPVVKVGASATVFPWDRAGQLPPGTYAFQAVLMTNRDLWFPGAPGNWFSKPVVARVEVGQRSAVKVALSETIPAETLPADQGLVRYRKIRSAVLSRFWGRDIFVRVGVVLPATWESQPMRRYPVVIDIGGFGSRFHRAGSMFRENRQPGRVWREPEAPQFLWVTLDGAGPLGDPYQVDSENHGPYGTSLVDEVIPAIEHEFRGIGQPWARLTTGGSTGGWVSFALQVLYPDLFGGCWSGYPDPLDFRDFQLMNLYGDTNAFVQADGLERPSKRTEGGKVDFSVRHEVRYENVLGLGGTYTRSGGQWGAWNATFGARGTDGLPVPAWDPVTGVMSRPAVKAWERWDLRRVVEDNWPTLAPKLRGKLRVWVGDADEYYLERGVRRMEEFLGSAQPPSGARFEYGAGKLHGWSPRPFAGLLREMQAAVEGGAPKETGREAYFRARFLHGNACVHCKGGR